MPPCRIEQIGNWNDELLDSAEGGIFFVGKNILVKFEKPLDYLVIIVQYPFIPELVSYRCFLLHCLSADECLFSYSVLSFLFSVSGIKFSRVYLQMINRCLYKYLFY